MIWTKEFAATEGVKFIRRLVRNLYSDDYDVSVSYDDTIPAIDVSIGGAGESLIESFSLSGIDRARASYAGGVSAYIKDIIDGDIKDQSR